MSIKSETTYLFATSFKVRDYECDLQGVVNNANYQHYMEHSRHEFLNALGEDFADLHARGVDMFVRNVRIEYLTALRSGDSFISMIDCHKQGPKLIFQQDLYFPDGKVVAKGSVEAVAVVNHRLSKGEYFEELVKKAENLFSRCAKEKFLNL